MSMFAEAFKTVPATLPVTIESDKIPSIKFLFTPQGVLSGYVGINLDASDNPVGMYRAPDDNVKIKSISLTGASVDRKLIPSQNGEINLFDHYLMGKDYAHKAGFCFFGLAEGEYELSIEAEGYEVYTAKQRVVPGKLVGYLVDELTPLE